MLEHEKALLEAILKKDLVIDECLVVPELFTDPTMYGIFRAIIATRGKGVRVDAISLTDTLREMGRDDLVVQAATFSPASPANAAYYADRLRDEMRRRQLAPVVRDALAMLADPNRPLGDALKALSDGIVDVQRSERATEDPTIAGNFAAYLQELRRREKDDGTAGAVFGMECLDQLLGSNIGPGELVAIAARPGVGKTALAIQMAIHNSTRRGIPSTIFSLEMLRDEVYDRIYAPMATGGIQALRNGIAIQSRKTEEALESLTTAMHRGGVRIYQESMTPATLAANIRRDAMVHGTKLFVVDYLGLLDFGSDAKTARWERVGDASRMFKRLALELGVAIVLCVQLGRAAEGKEPTIADLRDSGAIEQDCNRVMLIHRLNEKDQKSDYEADVIVAKNRGGPRGRAHLMFIGARARFEELARP